MPKGHGDGSRPHQFKAGQSGNPGGRPAWLKEVWAQYHDDVPALIGALKDMALNKDGETPHAARIAASKEILDRIFGKARQAMELADADGNAMTLGVVLIPPKKDG